MFGDTLTIVAVAFMAALSVGGIAYVLIYPLLSGEAKANKRMARVAGGQSGRASRAAANMESQSRDQRRKQMQKTLLEMEQNQKQKKKRVSLAMTLTQAGSRHIRPGVLGVECVLRDVFRRLWFL